MQPLPSVGGEESTALESICGLFPVTREILGRRGRSSISFSKVPIPVMNQLVLPFATKWHRQSPVGDLGDDKMCAECRHDVEAHQGDLRNYSRLLAQIARVEDLTALEMRPDAGDAPN